MGNSVCWGIVCTRYTRSSAVLANILGPLPVTKFCFSVNNRWLFNSLDWVPGEAGPLLDKRPGVWLSAVPGRVENGFLGGPGLDAAPRVGHDG